MLHVCLLFLGHDSKALMNNSGPRYKRSKVERDLNVDVVACVIILFILCFLGGVGKYFLPVIDNTLFNVIKQT